MKTLPCQVSRFMSSEFNLCHNNYSYFSVGLINCITAGRFTLAAILFYTLTS